ncbi:hypothetical protein JW898_04410 [Candidatus Woesearchaeota archaeon]|nr:hypothetical protein [Candidatus Woesearchaeota archaeon]
MDKRAQGMGVIGGGLFTLGACMAIVGYFWNQKPLLYAGIGLCVLGAVAYKLVKV